MQLNFIEQGQGAPVILLHGLFGSMRNLGFIARPLAQSFKVYLLDQRNHGDSVHLSNMTYQEMADDVVRFMDQQELQTAHIVGHSMGGKTAMQLALSQPQRVDRLVVADIAPVAYPRRHDSILEGLNQVQAAQVKTRKEADAILATYVAEADVRAFLLKSLMANTNGQLSFKFNLKDIERNYEQIIAAPSGQPFHGPTLFIKGATSAYIQAQHKEQVLSLFPNAQMKIIAGAGHWLHAEKPALFNRLVNEFLVG